jgi:hypothetical protein
MCLQSCKILFILSKKLASAPSTRVRFKLVKKRARTSPYHEAHVVHVGVLLLGVTAEHAYWKAVTGVEVGVLGKRTADQSPHETTTGATIFISCRQIRQNRKIYMNFMPYMVAICALFSTN